MSAMTVNYSLSEMTVIVKLSLESRVEESPRSRD